MGALADRFLSEPTLQTITPQETEEQRHEAYGHGASEEEVKGFIVEGDLFAGYGLHQKAIDQYQRVADAIPHQSKLTRRFATCTPRVAISEKLRTNV